MGAVPVWVPSMSDGCSALPVGPILVRRRVNHWLFAGQPGATAVCEGHDEDYHYGGSKQDRLASDLRMRVRWEAIGVKRWKRVVVYRLIRTFGGPRWRTPGVSWAFGGDVFKYTDEPAT